MGKEPNKITVGNAIIPYDDATELLTTMQTPGWKVFRSICDTELALLAEDVLMRHSPIEEIEYARGQAFELSALRDKEAELVEAIKQSEKS